MLKGIVIWSLMLTSILIVAPFPAIASVKPVKNASRHPASFSDPTTGIEFVLVKGGCFQMGGTNKDDAREDETPVHKVCVDSFYIGRYDVTQNQWEKLMEWNPSRFKKCGPNCPVEDVSWDDVQDFITRLNAKSNKKYRLPTEAEWEFAARSRGKKERFSGGKDLDKLAWYDDNSDKKTHPVGQKQPNGLGLYDMSGNVWQWVNDWYDDKYYNSSPKNNPQGATSGLARVLRGGSWDDDDWNARTTTRNSKTPRFGNSLTGFRLAMPLR